MSGFHIVVCGSLVPDPLQTLEPTTGSDGPGLKNAGMLPSVLDPWAAHALYEAAHLAGQVDGSRVWLVSLGPRARLQQLMMNVAQKVPFELVALDGSASGFSDAHEVGAALAEAIEGIEGLERSRMLLFGGRASASRDAGVTMGIIGERLGIEDQFVAVDKLEVLEGGRLRILERIEGGQYLASTCDGPPILCAWSTGELPEPPNNPQLGMQNMRNIMPALQSAQPVQLTAEGLTYRSVALPDQRRETRIVKDAPVEEMAREIAEWLRS